MGVLHRIKGTHFIVHLSAVEADVLWPKLLGPRLGVCDSYLESTPHTTDKI